MIFNYPGYKDHNSSFIATQRKLTSNTSSLARVLRMATTEILAIAVGEPAKHTYPAKGDGQHNRNHSNCRLALSINHPWLTQPTIVIQGPISMDYRYLG